MNRFFTTAMVATVGLALLAVAPSWAAGPSGQRHSMSGGHDQRGHSFRANERFDYRSHGFRSLSWTHYRWSSTYHCYCYYAPRYGWCFYEPTCSYYVPVSYFSTVYPQSSSVAPVVSPTPSVVQQQTTVVTVPPTTAPEQLPTPPAVTPAPTAVQKTQVGAPNP